MLKSLFGDLGVRGGDRARSPATGDFAATVLLDAQTTELSERGKLIDRHSQDLFVTGSAAEAIRSHLASTSAAGSERPAQVITLYDPARMWASAVVKALSDASGQSIERLHLRDQATLATLAMIERTTLARRDEGRVKIYHAEVRDGVADGTSVPMALMEASDIAAVIVGPLHSAMVDSMLGVLLSAALKAQFRCTRMLFMVPVGADWIEQKIRDVPWPRHLEVRIVSEPLTSASAVWNLLLTQWTDDPHAPAPAPAYAEAALLGATSLTAEEPARVPVASTIDISRREPDELMVLRAMREVMLPGGVVGAALVNVTSGALMATEGGGTLDLELAAASATDLMRAHQRAMRYYAPAALHTSTTPVDEVTAAAGGRVMVMRTVAAHPHIFMLLILDRTRARPDEIRTHMDEAIGMLM